ncbi:MAG: biotin--[acetyl-CoA-carboxylase] ligase [bacterium]|nr:biotin--[acetyl-CoA-carboxylase] ligase [bacterium]
MDSAASAYTKVNLAETVLGVPDQSWIGSYREDHDEIESTQPRAVELLREGKLGAIVVAKKQTAGLGRMGKSFYSARELGLYVSITLPAPPDLSKLSLVSLWAGIALLRTVREGGIILSMVPINLTKRLSLKWPNDLLLDGKKLAGILTTSVVAGSQPMGVVLGIGININHVRKDFPLDIRDKAISLRVATGKKWELEDFLTHLTEVLEKMWHYLKEPQDQLLAEWLRWGPPIDTPLSVTENETVYNGTFAGLTTSGELVLQLPDGTKRTFLSGIVEHLSI